MKQKRPTFCLTTGPSLTGKFSKYREVTRTHLLLETSSQRSGCGLQRSAFMSSWGKTKGVPLHRGDLPPITAQLPQLPGSFQLVSLQTDPSSCPTRWLCCPLLQGTNPSVNMLPQHVDRGDSWSTGSWAGLADLGLICSPEAGDESTVANDYPASLPGRPIPALNGRTSKCSSGKVPLKNTNFCHSQGFRYFIPLVIRHNPTSPSKTNENKIL